MRIRDAVTQARLPAKTVRYDEEAGLIEPATRSANGRRDHSERDVRMPHFVRRARSLGFTMRDRRELLALYDDRRRSSAGVQIIADRRLQEIECRLAALESPRAVPTDPIDRCPGDDRPDCPIPDDLAAWQDVRPGLRTPVGGA